MVSITGVVVRESVKHIVSLKAAHVGMACSVSYLRVSNQVISLSFDSFCSLLTSSQLSGLISTSVLKIGLGRFYGRSAMSSL